MKKNIIIILLLFICTELSAQHWAPIGNFNNGVESLFSDSATNSLYIGGGFTQFNADTVFGICKWDGQNMSTMSCGCEWDCITSTNQSNVNGALSIAKFNNEIYITGYFTKAGNTIVHGIAKWNGTNWIAIGTGLKDSIGGYGHGNRFELINNELYLCGAFDSVAGVSAHSIAKFDGTNWSAVNNFPIISTIGDYNYIYDVALFNNELYVCGLFYNSTIYNIIKWNGTNWIPADYGIRGGIVQVLRMLVYNNKLIIGGYFSQSQDAGNPGNYITSFDGTNWSDMNGGMDNQVSDMIVHNNELYVVGKFNYASWIPANEIARWDGHNWCSFGDYFDNTLGAITFYQDTMYIGGGFWSINGDSTIHRMAKWIGGGYVDSCGTVGIRELANESLQVLVYPNPASNTITISLSNESGIRNYALRIIDILGRDVYKSTLNGDNSIDVSNLSDGIYYWEVVSKNGVEGKGKIAVIK
jgi:hypothetical protein